MKITGNRKTASPFPLYYTSKAGFPLQISTGVRCRYVFPMRHKNTANGYCLRLSTAFEICSTPQKYGKPTNRASVSGKKFKIFEIHPDFAGARGNLFPSLYIWMNVMKWIYREYIFFPLCHAKAMHLHRESMHLHRKQMHLHGRGLPKMHLQCIWSAFGMHLHRRTMHLHKESMHLHSMCIPFACHVLFGFLRFVFLRWITPRRMMTLLLRYGFVSVIR